MRSTAVTFSRDDGTVMVPRNAKSWSAPLNKHGQ